MHCKSIERDGRRLKPRFTFPTGWRCHCGFKWGVSTNAVGCVTDVGGPKVPRTAMSVSQILGL